MQTALMRRCDNAFDTLRWFFALSLLCFHFSAVTATTPFSPITGKPIVSAFFILSGLLTLRSYEQQPQWRHFFVKRLRRIVPAYALVILLSVVAGSLLTRLSFTAYWGNADTWRYVVANMTMMNFVQPLLPDVFTGQPLAAVNGSLWTMKIEVGFYLLFPLCFLFIRRKPWVTLVGLYSLGVCYDAFFGSLYEASAEPMSAFMRRQLPGQLPYFAAGMACHLLTPRLLRHRYAALLASVVAYAISVEAGGIDFLRPLCFALLLTSVAYALPSLFRRRLPDVTYEIYLVHFPVFQVCMSLFAHLPPLPLFVVSVTLAVLSAVGLRRLSKGLVRVLP